MWLVTILVVWFVYTNILVGRMLPAARRDQAVEVRVLEGRGASCGQGVVFVAAAVKERDEQPCSRGGVAKPVSKTRGQRLRPAGSLQAPLSARSYHKLPRSLG